MAIASQLVQGVLVLLVISLEIRGSWSLRKPTFRIGGPATTHVTVDGRTAKFCSNPVCNRKDLQCETIQRPTGDGCYCDPSCRAFGDCCYDYQDIRDKCNGDTAWKALEAVLPEVRQRSKYMSCNGTHFSQPIYSVSMCPPGADTSMERLCQDGFQPGAGDIYSRVPVTVGGIPFNNVYCALCHKLPLTDVKYWPVDFACPDEFKQSGRFTPEAAIFISLNTDKSSDCNTTVVESRDNAALYRNCDPLKDTKINGYSPVAECFVGEQLSLLEPVYTELVRNCSTYDAYVFSSNPLAKHPIYKNMYCAFCQNSTLDDLYCGPIVPTSVIIQVPVTSYVPFLSSTETVIIPGGFRSLLELPDPTADKKCGNGTVLDPILGSCRSRIRCNIGFVEWNDACILDPFLPAYGTPRVDYEDHITLWMNTTLNEPIKVMCSDDDLELAPDFPLKALASAVEKNVQQIIRVDGNQWLESRTIVYDKNLMESITLIGGKEVIFRPGIVVETSIVLPSAIMDPKSLGEVIEMNYPLRHKWSISYSILNRGVKDGVIKCSSGKLLEISLAAGSGVSDYYFAVHRTDPLIVAVQKDAMTLKTGQYEVTDVTASTMRQRLSVDNQVLICDEYSQFFEGCSTGALEYHISNFTIRGHGVFSKDSELFIRRSDVVIAGDRIYLCPERLEQPSSLAEVVITYVGMVLSILFLVYLLITYGLFQQLRTLPGKMLMHLSCCLIVAQLLFMFGHTAFTIPPLCSVLGMIQHYAFLATFCWMNAIAINTVRTFTSPMARGSSPSKKYWIICAATYGVPFLVFVTGGVLEFATTMGPFYGSRSCWMVHRIYMIATFVVPVGAIIAANLIIFVIAVVSINKTTRATKSTIGKKNKAEFFIYARLAFLMGFTWIFGFIAIFAGINVIWYIFTILNTSQGLFIGLSFGCNGRVRKLYRKKLHKGDGYSTSGSNSQSTKMGSLGTSAS